MEAVDGDRLETTHARFPATGTTIEGSALSRAELLVTDLARVLETGEASRALADGDRAGAEAVLSLADRLRGLVQTKERGVAAAGDNALRDLPASRPIEPQQQVVASRAHAKRSSPTTAFRRSGSQIVKLGMLGTANAYRHFAPLSLLERVARVAEGMMRDRGEFGFDDVSTALPNDKGYQVRLVIAWMRSIGLLAARTKGRYLAESDIATRVVSAAERLEEERGDFVCSTRPRRRSLRKESNRRRGSAKRATAV